MTTETYTNGYGDDALRLMTRRTLASHGAFILPLLQPGQCILDLGCGPGNLTRELAQRVAPGGSVVGVDRSGGQLPALAAEEGEAVTFHAMDAYQLAFEDASFDGVFSHALFEHVARPLDVLAEARRVLRPGGFIGLRSPDWGGMVLHPWDAAIGEALAARLALQTRNGGRRPRGAPARPVVARGWIPRRTGLGVLRDLSGHRADRGAHCRAARARRTGRPRGGLARLGRKARGDVCAGMVRGHRKKSMNTPLENKSTLDEIRARFDADVERFSRLETGQQATMDAPLVLELVARTGARHLRAGDAVLDLGCGAGNFTLRLLQEVGGLHCHLVDLSRPMLDRGGAAACATRQPRR